MKNPIPYFITIIITFIIFVGILFYSYIFKLGYFPKVTYLMFFLVIILIILNVFNNTKNLNYFSFWTILFILFLYAFTDKFFHLHNLLGAYLNLGTDGGTIVQTTYLISFLLIIAFFNKFLTEQYKKNPHWLYLFIFAYFLSVIGVISDFVYHNKIEDYFELFSLYFFASAFLLILISKREIK